MKKRISLLLCLLLTLGLLLTGCGSTPANNTDNDDNDDEILQPIDELDDENTGDDDLLLPGEDFDLSTLEGIWLCGAEYDYDYMSIAADGSWELYRGYDVVISGWLEYVPEYEAVYAFDAADGSACRFAIENDELYFASYGYFSYADGMEGIWYENG